MNKPARRFQLAKETVRQLNSVDLGKFVGGDTNVRQSGSGACLSEFGGCGTGGSTDCGGCNTFYCCVSTCFTAPPPYGGASCQCAD